MEIEMRASRFPTVAGLAGVVIATSMLLAPESFAQGRHGLASDTSTRAYSESAPVGYYTYPGSVPRDYNSSHLCINGYRWITTQHDLWEDPAANATPVRCR